MDITITAANVRPDKGRRQLRGTLIRYGEVGQTDAGPLRVEDPDAITIPPDLATIPLTLEHTPTTRGHLHLVDNNEERLYIVAQVDDGPLGDAALAEAAPPKRERAGFSYVVTDADVVDGVLVAGRLTAIGQVAEPAYNASRIDQIAACKTPGTGPGTPEGDTTMTEEQKARLAELAKKPKDDLTEDEATELAELQALAKAEADEDQAGADGQADDAGNTNKTPARVAASVPQPLRRSAKPKGSALDRMYADLTAALNGQRSLASISAALTDITETGNQIEAPAWSGELWSGLAYQPKWSNQFNQGALTSFDGQGWRWVVKPALADYAGDKAAVPSNTVSTEPASYSAARMAVGHDIDRKFYDFPNQEFLRSYAEAAREDWARKLDVKVRDFVIANATPNPAVDPDTTSLLKAAAIATQDVEDATGAMASAIAVNSGDFLTLMDSTLDVVAVIRDLFGIEPKSFIRDAAVPAGTVFAWPRPAATVRTLPGSPIRVDAQHIANGGIDTAFFGYWAIEEHHTTGIRSATWA